MMFVLLFLCSAASSARLNQEKVDMTISFDEAGFNHLGLKKFETSEVDKNNERFQSEYLTVGTVIDSPALFSATGRAVDQLPLQRLIAPAAIVDITPALKLDPDYEATVEDLLYWEALTGQTLNDTILLLKSGWRKKWNNQRDLIGMNRTTLHHPGLAPEAAKWLVEKRNVYGIGVETPRVDRSSSKTRETQKILLRHNVFTVQNIANLDKIPIYGATLHVIPLKIRNLKSAPVRVFAVYPIVLFEYMPAVGSDKSF